MRWAAASWAGVALLGVAAAAMPRGPEAASPAAAARPGSAPSPNTRNTSPSPISQGSPAPGAASTADEDERLRKAAETAWRFVGTQYQPATGLVNAVHGYTFTTIWDVGSALAAYHCAQALGLTTPEDADRRMRKLLQTMVRLPLFDGAAYNRSYSTRTGEMAGRLGGSSRRGAGWSATDLGRLLVWLKIVAREHPPLAEAAAAVVNRLERSRIVKDGYMYGAALEGKGLFEFQEGRIGYEQYSARGFELWGFPVGHAADIERHSVPLEVNGHRLAADLRGSDRLTSEPFVLLGLEVGFSPAEKRIATELLAAQEERWRRTGRLTLASEDAVSRPPHFFYYYCVYTNGKEFAVDVQDPRAVVSGPRWVSTKGAFAWHALFPSEYTRRLLAALEPARGNDGWGSGVEEDDGRSTATANINTQGVILEAMLYRRLGRPLLLPETKR